MIVADNELVRKRHPQRKQVTVAHHVEHTTLHDGKEAHHPEKLGLADEDVATDLLVLRDFSAFASPHGGSYSDCSFQRLNLFGLYVDSLN